MNWKNYARSKKFWEKELLSLTHGLRKEKEQMAEFLHWLEKEILYIVNRLEEIGEPGPVTIKDPNWNYWYGQFVSLTRTWEMLTGKSFDNEKIHFERSC